MARYGLRFVSLIEAPAYLRDKGLPGDRIDRLMAVVQTYSPDRDLLLVLSSGGHPEVNWLQNLAIAPPECHRQVCDRWAEFNLRQTSPTPGISGQFGERLASLPPEQVILDTHPENSK